MPRTTWRSHLSMPTIYSLSTYPNVNEDTSVPLMYEIATAFCEWPRIDSWFFNFLFVPGILSRRAY
jgi:hypothetical protein